MSAQGKYVPSKKSRYSKKAHKPLKAFSTRMVTRTMGLVVPKDPFGAMTPRFFKVQLPDSIIYCNGSNTVAQFDSNLSPVPWMNLGAAFADSTGAAGASQFGFTVRAVLSDLSNAANFTDLFQQFCILKMDIKISQTCGDSYGGVILPTIYSAPDDNDSVVFASQVEVNGYQAVKEHALSADRPFSRSCYPKPATAQFINAISTGYAVTPSPSWVDANSSGTAHYAMKFYVRNFINGPNSGMGIRVQPCLYFACRNPH